MTTTPYRSSDIDSATEVIPAVPSFPAVPAQRVAPSVEDYQVMTVGEAAGARMWQRGQAPTPTAAPTRATGPTAAPSRGTGSAATRVAPASPAPAPLPAAEPWPTTLSRREAKQAAPTRRRRWPWLTGGLAVGLLLGVAIGQGMGGDPATATAPSTAPSPATVAAPAPESVTIEAPAPAAPAQPAGPETTVSDGTYEVGVDMAAGRYKTDGPSAGSITGMCYWQRSSNDSGEFDAIIANEIVQGPGSVTVKSGEFATLSGDCTWTKV